MFFFMLLFLVSWVKPVLCVCVSQAPAQIFCRPEQGVHRDQIQFADGYTVPGPQAFVVYGCCWTLGMVINLLWCCFTKTFLLS